MKKVLFVESGVVVEIVYVDNDVDVIVVDSAKKPKTHSPTIGEDNDGDVNSLPEGAQKVISN